MIFTKMSRSVGVVPFLGHSALSLGLATMVATMVTMTVATMAGCADSKKSKAVLPQILSAAEIQSGLAQFDTVEGSHGADQLGLQLESGLSACQRLAAAMERPEDALAALTRLLVEEREQLDRIVVQFNVYQSDAAMPGAQIGQNGQGGQTERLTILVARLKRLAEAQGGLTPELCDQLNTLIAGRRVLTSNIGGPDDRCTHAAMNGQNLEATVGQNAYSGVAQQVVSACPNSDSRPQAPDLSAPLTGPQNRGPSIVAAPRPSFMKWNDLSLFKPAMPDVLRVKPWRPIPVALPVAAGGAAVERKFGITLISIAGKASSSTSFGGSSGDRASIPVTIMAPAASERIAVVPVSSLTPAMRSEAESATGAPAGSLVIAVPVDAAGKASGTPSVINTVSKLSVPFTGLTPAGASEVVTSHYGKSISYR